MKTNKFSLENTAEDAKIEPASFGMGMDTQSFLQNEKTELTDNEEEVNENINGFRQFMNQSKGSMKRAIGCGG